MDARFEESISKETKGMSVNGLLVKIRRLDVNWSLGLGTILELIVILEE